MKTKKSGDLRPKTNPISGISYRLWKIWKDHRAPLRVGTPISIVRQHGHVIMIQILRHSLPSKKINPVPPSPWAEPNLEDSWFTWSAFSSTRTGRVAPFPFHTLEFLTFFAIEWLTISRLFGNFPKKGRAIRSTLSVLWNLSANE